MKKVIKYDVDDGWLDGWFFGFYGIATYVGYLMPNPFLNKL